MIVSRKERIISKSKQSSTIEYFFLKRKIVFGELKGK